MDIWQTLHVARRFVISATSPLVERQLERLVVVPAQVIILSDKLTQTHTASRVLWTLGVVSFYSPIPGFAPFGYRFEFLPNTSSTRFVVIGLAVDENEAQIVRLIYHLYIFGDESNTPLIGIALTRKLSGLKIPTPGENRGGMRRKRGARPWSKATVHKILANETYIGLWHYSKRIAANGKRGYRQKDEQIVVNVPPIIEHDMWKKARQRRDYNR